MNLGTLTALLIGFGFGAGAWIQNCLYRWANKPRQSDAVRSDGRTPINGWIYLHIQANNGERGYDLACKRVPWDSWDPAEEK